MTSKTVVAPREEDHPVKVEFGKGKR